MKIDTGLAVVVGAVLIFYLRLIILQRERAKRIAKPPEIKGKSSKKSKMQPAAAPTRYSVLSQNPRDLIIAGVGAIAILVGVLLNARILPFSGAQSYWWVPVAAGIIAFSWAFKL